MLLKIMQLYMPDFIKKKKLNELLQLTAEAFKSEQPELKGLSFTECLTIYALFTKEQAEKNLQSERPYEEVKNRLYHNSYLYGQKLKKSFHIASWGEAAKLLKTIYNLIGIDFQYNSQGDILIKQCFYSKYYSSEVCKLMSSMDDGLAAGLSGGGSLRFHQRITEGYSCCKGYFNGEISDKKIDSDWL